MDPCWGCKWERDERFGGGGSAKRVWRWDGEVFRDMASWELSSMKVKWIIVGITFELSDTKVRRPSMTATLIIQDT